MCYVMVRISYESNIIERSFFASVPSWYLCLTPSYSSTLVLILFPTITLCIHSEMLTNQNQDTSSKFHTSEQSPLSIQPQSWPFHPPYHHSTVKSRLVWRPLHDPNKHHCHHSHESQWQQFCHLLIVKQTILTHLLIHRQCLGQPVSNWNLFHLFDIP